VAGAGGPAGGRRATQGEWWFTIGLLLVALLALPPDWRQHVPLHRLLAVGGGAMVILLLPVVVGTPTAVLSVAADAEQSARIWLGTLLVGLAAVRLFARPWATARAFDSKGPGGHRPAAQPVRLSR
jgi:hypothetical protein